MKKILILAFIALTVAVSPVKAHAFSLGQLIDPLCLFACDKGSGGHNTKIVNSYNTNSNNTSNTVVATTNGGCGSCGYPSTPNYPSGGSQSQLGASCYATPTYGSVGDTIYWRASTYGGTGSYYITWSGSDSLSGYGTNVSRSYNTPGSKYASITVTSGNQTTTRNCDTNVEIRDTYNYNYNYNNNYNYDYYNYNNNYNTPLYVSCSANTSSAPLGSSIAWTANVSGGNGYYNYSWSGTDYLYGSGRTVNTVYQNPGTKTASVTVFSGNQTVTQSCYNSVSIGNQNYNYNYGYNYNYNNTSGIQIACYPDKASARIGTPVTWGVEATGGNGYYTYSWTGSDGLSSTQLSAVKAYSTSGSKSATVTVSSNGQSATQVCGSNVTITNGNASSGTTVKPTTSNQNNESDNSLSAAALFSLKNVPWGWVAILVILVLFGMVLYLIYNRKKI